MTFFPKGTNEFQQLHSSGPGVARRATSADADVDASETTMSIVSHNKRSPEALSFCSCFMTLHVPGHCLGTCCHVHRATRPWSGVPVALKPSHFQEQFYPIPATWNGYHFSSLRTHASTRRISTWGGESELDIEYLHTNIFKMPRTFQCCRILSI